MVKSIVDKVSVYRAFLLGCFVGALLWLGTTVAEFYWGHGTARWIAWGVAAAISVTVVSLIRRERRRVDH